MSAPPYELRPAGHDDVAGITALDRADEAAIWGQAETDASDVRHELAGVGDPRTRTQVAVGPDGVLAFAVVRPPHGELRIVISPALSDDDAWAVGGALMRWVVDAGAREADHPADDHRRRRLLMANGFSPFGSNFELERVTTEPVGGPSWPPGVTVGAFDPTRDVGPVHRLVYSVWTDVPGHHFRAEAAWRQLFCEHEAFDPWLQVLAYRGTDLVGVAMNRVYGVTDGWISQLAVARPAQGAGLGRALLVESTRRLTAVEGVATVGLSVMASNDRALRLYRDVGFEIDREYVLCRRRWTGAR